MLAVVAASVAAFAQPPQAPSPVAFTVKYPTKNQPATNQIQAATPFNYNPFKAHPQKESDKVIRVDGMSSQPWYRMAGPKPGWSAFPPPERQNPAFNLVWIGATPER